MKEDISDPRKLAAKADEIWQSFSARSVNTLSATSSVSPGSDDSFNYLRQCPQPQTCFWCCSLSCSTSCMSSVLQYNLPSLLVSLQTWGSGSTLQNSLHVGSRKLTGRQEVYALPAGDSTLFFLQYSLYGDDFLLTLEPLFQFFHRFLHLHQLLSLRPSSSPLVVFLCLVLELVSYHYILVLDTSPGLSS